jgi:hypothetical protein
LPLSKTHFKWVFSWASKRDKTLIRDLAVQRKLRPVFVEKKPKAERHVWLQKALSQEVSDSEAAQTLQIWLLGANRDMLCEFPDALGVAHDGKGVVEDLPAEPSKEALEKTINGLLEKHEPEAVWVYLRTFQLTNDVGWGTLATLIDSDKRLALQPAPASTAPAAPPHPSEQPI